MKFVTLKDVIPPETRLTKPAAILCKVPMVLLVPIGFFIVPGAIIKQAVAGWRRGWKHGRTIKTMRNFPSKYHKS